jgi:hypothetical protein
VFIYRQVGQEQWEVSSHHDRVPSAVPGWRSTWHAPSWRRRVLRGVPKDIDGFGDRVFWEGEHRGLGNAVSGDHEDEVDDPALGAAADALLGEVDAGVFGDLLALFEVVESSIADPGVELLGGAEAMQALVNSGLVPSSVGDGVGGESDGPVEAPL